MSHTNIHWVCVGYDTKKHMNDALGYLTDTAKQAEARCKELHPNFEIYFTCRADQFKNNRIYFTHRHDQ